MPVCVRMAKSQVMQGQLPFSKPGSGESGEGVKFLSVLGVSTVGGKSTTTDAGVTIEGADEAVLLISAGTNLRNPGHEEQVRSRLQAALATPFEKLLADATRDHASYMDRCKLELPAGPNAKLPTPERVRLNEAIARSGARGAVFPVRPPPDCFRFAPGFAVADQPARHLGGGVFHPVAR